MGKQDRQAQSILYSAFPIIRLQKKNVHQMLH